MGIKKIFMKKDPTEEEILEGLNRAGITTKSGNSREEKFGAFKNYAQERAQMKSGFKPVNPYANAQVNDPAQNPYANSQNGSSSSATLTSSSANSYSAQKSSSPYSNPPTSSASTSTATTKSTYSPYGQQRSQTRGASQYEMYSRPTSRQPVPTPSPQHANPYGSSRARVTADSTVAVAAAAAAPSRPRSAGAGATANAGAGAGFGDGFGANSVSRVTTRQSTRGDTDSSLDLNAITSHDMFRNSKPIKKQTFDDGDDGLDLNKEYNFGEEEEMDLNLDIPEEVQEVNSEDEEVDAIKQDIRFLKQESVQSTRNTLRMAQEADASGTNTLGMLGSQSERLYNAEQSLLLADTQTQIADEKVKELKRLNRSIFVPAYGNPFNKKSRLRQQEENLKARKMQEKYLRENNRQGMYESEQRIKQGLMNNATNNDVHQKYQNEKYLNQAQRYQFENDSEDDEIEKEIASNLDQIGSYAKKLHGIANTMGKEVDSQNIRLRKIEEDADKLDINVHMNSTRLNNIR
ncbi:SEC9 [Candida oxycetoniae]|uniref:SEC9 n=1 Tax=Candida oxycetoniae TaxID=497107 RepID=A0AAI9T222_9ASCO|nr:SEC9 [Candida oxycetoniae]KAI3407115.2 SEC9 [Candida oxycetoniae]